MSKALNDMGTSEGFRGYGPEQRLFLAERKISENDFISRGCKISPKKSLFLMVQNVIVVIF